MKVRLVALDFDETIVDIHTGGVWERSAADLAMHMRLELKCLIEQALARKDVSVAVATFSRQEELIRQVMTIAFPEASTGTLAVFGGNNRTSKQGKKV